jgi:type II secretory pathway component PulF
MKSHKFDAISFISGVVATALGLAFLIPQTPVGLIDMITSLGAWFWPVVLVVVGIAILVPVFVSRDSEEERLEHQI